MKTKNIKEFKEISQRGSPGAFDLKETHIQNYPNWVIRRISLLITRVVVKINISPNSISIFSIILGMMAGFLFMLGEYIYSIFAIISMFIWFVLDHVDGEVARYKNQKSNLGHYLDKMMHCLVHPLLFLGIGFGLYNKYGSITWLTLGIISAFSLFLIDLVYLNKLETRVYKNLIKDGKKLIPKTNFKFNFLYQFQWVFIFIIIATILDILEYFLLIYTVVLFFKFVISLFNTIRNQDNWK